MRQLSPEGQQAIADIARQRGFSFDATMTMLDAIIAGNGGMAQFNHPEFSGSGQWMQGGMIMISDMFNNNLKWQIDGLCSELAGLVANQPGLIRSGSFQSQSQGAQSQGSQSQGSSHSAPFDNTQWQGTSGPASQVSLFVPPPAGGSDGWWPAGIGWPNSTGAQNNVRYAYFQQARRLAIDVNGTVTVYDTLDHQIGGFSQQQSYGGSITFSSQYGLVSVADLPVVSVNGVPQAPPPDSAPLSAAPISAAPTPEAGGSDIIATISKLADLHAKGILSDTEFAAKKTELLARL
jgi:hypothetical protein